MDLSIHDVSKFLVTEPTVLESGTIVRDIRIVTETGEELTVHLFSKALEPEIEVVTREALVLRRKG